MFFWHGTVEASACKISQAKTKDDGTMHMNFSWMEKLKIIFFFAVWETARKLNKQIELIFYFIGQNEPDYNRISILLL